ERGTMAFTVYILQCADGSYYTGLTRSPIEQRLWEHNAGVVEGYTQSRRPVVLRHLEMTESARHAIERERQIKGWNRAKKEALMSGRYEALPKLSRTAKPDGR